MKKYASQFNELIVMAEKAKKKGGSMASVFKLIQELLDFEEKIQECINAQEMSENQNKIEAFMGDIDRLYDVLFEIARGGISSIRNDRAEGMQEVVEEGEEEVEIEGTGRFIKEDELRERGTEVTKDIVPLSVPKAPRI